MKNFIEVQNVEMLFTTKKGRRSSPRSSDGTSVSGPRSRSIVAYRSSSPA